MRDLLLSFYEKKIVGKRVEDDLESHMSGDPIACAKHPDLARESG